MTQSAHADATFSFVHSPDAPAGEAFAFVLHDDPNSPHDDDITVTPTGGQLIISDAAQPIVLDSDSQRAGCIQPGPQSVECNESGNVGYFLYLGAGNDKATASMDDGEKSVYVYGEAGDDQLTATGNSEINLDGGDGNDTIKALGSGTLWATGGDGNDTISVQGQGSAVADGEGGNDTLTGGSIASTLRGGIGDDVITGTPGKDILEGGSGSDSISGGAGNDSIYGDNEFPDDQTSGNGFGAPGDGADHLDGGEGDDDISGQGGNDTLIGGPGSDDMRGGDGVDLVDAVDGAADSRVSCTDGIEGDTAKLDPADQPAYDDTCPGPGPDTPSGSPAPTSGPAKGGGHGSHPPVYAKPVLHLGKTLTARHGSVRIKVSCPAGTHSCLSTLSLRQGFSSEGAGVVLDAGKSDWFDFPIHDVLLKKAKTKRVYVVVKLDRQAHRVRLLVRSA